MVPRVSVLERFHYIPLTTYRVGVTLAGPDFPNMIEYHSLTLVHMRMELVAEAVLIVSASHLSVQRDWSVVAAWRGKST